MSEQVRKIDGHKWITTTCAALAASVVIGQYIFGAGGLFARDSLNSTHFQAQIDNLSSQVSRLADKMDNGPRADQIQDILRHLAAQDGRGDALDNRMRAVEQNEAAMSARIEGIDAASRAHLGNH